MNSQTVRMCFSGATALLFAGAAAAQSLPGPSTTLEPNFPRLEQPGTSDRVSERVKIKKLASTLLREATQAIATKAAALGWVGAALSAVEDAQDGYVQRFEHADVFFSEETGAHEIHGSIREKYYAARPRLGLPTTDEQGTPDGVGRYNHFGVSSIYHTSNTGAMIVRGAIRDFWAQHGWEQSSLGYPIVDEYRVRTGPNDPEMWWSVFQNGAIVAKHDRVAGTVEVAESSAATGFGVHIDATRVMDVLWHRFDYMVHRASDDLGLHPGVSIVNVTDWAPDFEHSVRRRVTFRLHGFRENPIIADTDFSVEMRLRFDLGWPVDDGTEPTIKSLVVSLESVTVGADGFGSGAVAAGVRDGVLAAFSQPQTLATFSVNDLGRMAEGFSPDFVDFNVTADGGIDILMNPVPYWFARGIRIPDIESAIEQLLGD